MSQILPALDAATEKALRSSIERRGVLVPILVDQYGRILDGHNRKRLADELGKPCPELACPVHSEEERRGVVIETNDARRPRLSIEQRRQVVADLRQEGHSLRAIAGAIGVSHKTVIGDLRQSGGDPAPPDPPAKVTGQDGKSYPAKRPKPLPAADNLVERGVAAIDQLRSSGPHQEEEASPAEKRTVTRDRDLVRPVAAMVTRTGAKGAELAGRVANMAAAIAHLREKDLAGNALANAAKGADREVVKEWERSFSSAAKALRSMAAELREA